MKRTYSQFYYNGAIYPFSSCEINGLFNQQLKGKMYCPSCLKALLKYNSKCVVNGVFRPSHLAAIDVRQHKEGCVYIYPILDQKSFNILLQDIEDNQIQILLDRQINQLFTQTSKSKAVANKQNSENIDVLRVKKGKDKLNYRVMKMHVKNLHQLNQGDEGIPILFYGKVFLKQEPIYRKSDSKECLILELLNPKTKDKITSLYFNVHLNISKTTLYAVSFFAYYQPSKVGTKIWKDLKLVDGRYRHFRFKPYQV